MATTKTAVKTKIAVITKTTALITAETMTKSNRQHTPAPTKKALGMFSEPSQTDVNGSYTGKPMDKRDKPVQDADDL